MKIGISTSSFFLRRHTEDALSFLSENNVETAEVFLETYSEYNKEFGKLLSARSKNLPVHSIHVLTTQFEPQLYSVNDRAQADSFKILRNVARAGKELSAKYYTFHGPARLKRTPLKINFDRVGRITQEIIDLLGEYSISLAYENVHWCYYNYVGYFNELKKRTHGLKATLDIKQARQSGVDYRDLIKEMSSDIVTVHVSDVNKDGKMCLPGKGVTDFSELFARLSDVGFDGAVLLEVYKDDFGDESELFDCVEYLKSVASKYYK